MIFKRILFIVLFLILHIYKYFFNISDQKVEDEPPAKLLDDLFKKTKTIPCIYWSLLLYFKQAKGLM